MTQHDLDHLQRAFRISQRGLLEAIQQYGTARTFAPGAVLINYEQYIKTVPLVISGSVKVMRGDQEGREVFLYYLRAGETCALSLTCCDTRQPSPIRAVVEDHTQLVTIPAECHEQWTGAYQEWKTLVARTHAARFQDLLQAIDSIAFQHMDGRLAGYLRKKFRQLDTSVLHITHQEIAYELGTSREVISRLLKQLEKRDLITLTRNKVTLRDTDPTNFLAM